MEKKAMILLMAMVFGLGVLGCAGEKSLVKPTPAQILPVKVKVDSIERLNAIPAKPPYQATDVLVYRVNFRLTNPNNALAKVEDFYFEAKVEDGTPQKTIVQAASMPSLLIPASGETLWSSVDIFVYGGVLGAFITRGLDAGEGMKGAIRMREEFWTDLGADKRKFFIDGNITYSLPDYPKLGTVRDQFKSEFTMPKL
ncbi:MAG: hypothetical protein HXY44_18265 [Syntrophaceae bacterium]|nr:hypothetical protein [Syntrophaceae bacterium]